MRPSPIAERVRDACTAAYTRPTQMVEHADMPSTETPFRGRHPGSMADGGRAGCEEGADPFAGSLPAPRGSLRELEFTSDRLGTLRRFVARAASEASLGPARTDDLVLAVDELATNSLCHGGGGGTLRIWIEADTLLCEVQDKGHITDPLVGQIPPQPSRPTGRGLWVVNHLCDLVQIRSSREGSAVRVHMRLPELAERSERRPS